MTTERRCIQCGKRMNAVEWIMCPVCGKCVRRNHKEATR